MEAGQEEANGSPAAAAEGSRIAGDSLESVYARFCALYERLI